MSAESPGSDKSVAASEALNSQPTPSILEWIRKTQIPPASQSAPLFDDTPARGIKRRRSQDSPSLECRGDQYEPSFHKNHKSLKYEAEDMGEHGVSRMQTPSAEGSTNITENSSLKSRDKTTTNPHTPKRQKTTTDQDVFGYRMSLHGLMQNEEVYEDEAAFKAFVADIVTSDRNSTMKDTSVKKFRDHLKVYERSNEVTFLHHMIPILQGDGYHVAVKPEFSKEEEVLSKQEGVEWRSFLSDEKIKATLNQDFARTLLPSKFYDDPALIQDMIRNLAKEKDMTTPRPDYVFGLQREMYSLAIETQIPEHVLDLLEIAPGMHHVFLIFEGKSHSGSSAKAENQARRGGATLVNGLRMLRAELEKEKNPIAEHDVKNSNPSTEKLKAIRPDYNSFVFSVTMSPTIFQIWVHWFDEASKLFHMNSVESYAIKNTKGPPQIRWALHNIIQWGSITRHAQNQALVESIKDYARRSKQKEQQSKLAEKEAALTAESLAQVPRSSPKKRRRPEESIE